MPAEDPSTPPPAALTRAHGRRLRDIYRSAGWPSQDPLEIDLLAAGLLERRRSPLGHETLRVTDGGAACIQYRTLVGGGELQRGQAVVVGTEVALDDRRDDRFEQAWNRQCLGRAYDVTAAFP